MLLAWHFTSEARAAAVSDDARHLGPDPDERARAAWREADDALVDFVRHSRLAHLLGWLAVIAWTVAVAVALLTR